MNGLVALSLKIVAHAAQTDIVTRSVEWIVQEEIGIPVTRTESDQTQEVQVII